jgi:Lrp/AsnC family transcriptional regulator for asnA, asnC and gidA
VGYTELDSETKIDEIDVKILKYLLKDARVPFSTIAKDCGVSTPAITKRYKRLKQEKVIVGTALRLDLDQLGYSYRLSVDINLDKANEAQIVKICKKMPDYITCQQTVGKYDIHAVVYIKTLEQIEQIRQIFKKLKGVKRVGLTATYESGMFPENVLIEPTEGYNDG